MSELVLNYILDEHGEPRPEPDLNKWGEWFGNIEARIVEQTMIGDVKVSTVFLAFDHNFLSLSSEPILWETMIFGGKHDGDQWRYPSRKLAVQGHRQACEIVRGE